MFLITDMYGNWLVLFKPALDSLFQGTGLLFQVNVTVATNK